MRISSAPSVSWRWVVAIGALAPAWVASASPAVNVALQASFDASPYLVELLESAAEENSTAYFPLLDRIADGAFEDVVTEKELYDRFLTVVHEDGHLRTPESLSSFKLALAIRSSAPRIQAHYQFYNTSVQHSLMAAQDAACPVWVHLEGKQYCSSAMERAQQDVEGVRSFPPTEISRNCHLTESMVTPLNPLRYFTQMFPSPIFKDFHEKLSSLAKEGHVSYRVRYRPPQHWVERPLFVSGYGVELALKRTDYIVIDDRDAEQRQESVTESHTGGIEDLKEDSPDDLRPLSASEVSRLGWNSAAYVMDSEDPLDTLVKLSENFPKYSAKVAGHDASVELRKEVRVNRGRMIPSGHNFMWINGVQIDERQIDAFSLLEHLRRERKLIQKFRDLGLSAQDTVKLLSHPLLAESQANDEKQRYDYRDELEGGNVIIWMNSLENDSRYDEWPNDLEAYLTNPYPGQMPPVARDLHNVIIPVDLTRVEDVMLLTRQIQTFVNRGIPVQFGLVPVTSSSESTAQLRVAHYLQETFGLDSLLQYLDESAENKKTGTPDKTAFTSATKEKTPRDNQEALSFEDVLKSDRYTGKASSTSQYLRRLDLTGNQPALLVNGVPVPRQGNWMQAISIQVSRDLKLAQQYIVEGLFKDDAWLPALFLSSAFEKRNSLLMPEDPKNVKIVDLAGVLDAGLLESIPRISSDKSVLESVHIIVVGDFDSPEGSSLLSAVLNFRKEHEGADIMLLQNDASYSEGAGSTLARIRNSLSKGSKVDEVLAVVASPHESDPDSDSNEQISYVHQGLAETLGFEPGATGLIINGRAIGPLGQDSTLSADEINQVVLYESQKRIEPVLAAAEQIGFGKKLASPIDLAKLTSLVSLSTMSEIPEGIFESAPDFRLDITSDWKTDHSVFTVTTSDDPLINIVAVLDPASEVSQTWMPIVKVLSKLAGVHLKVLMNPKEELKELPVKRFYRYVLESEPLFTEEGSLARPQASFKGIPKEALLTMGMDVPSSWLVAPKDSIHDLDNIKLSSLKSDSDVDAIYSLEHILIEGHTRDLTTKSAPRGVQLVLGSEENPHFADTIIMANLGYFQFKAQPGLWQISLKPGRSEKLFKIDSVGSTGYGLQESDGNEVTLLSFKGLTLFPRLSRKPGYENEDVLETDSQTGSPMDYVSKGLSFASGVLSSVGVGSKTDSEKHADINIFSVAIPVPFVPSIPPHLAKEYGFSYEMVTYKWPHWLRGQREKQREIWGYKILFLDVLFPLSLDKVIFVDADQIVRTDMYDLVTHDLEGAPYGFTPMGDSRTEMEGFRFWKQGYWDKFLRGKPYHISALYVVDLKRFRALATGDRLRGQYQMLSADPNSLSNLDQDLPNHMQHHVPIHSLPQEWLWCETWCSDEDLKTARTIDLCNNPLTKEPKLARAKRQVPEWTVYDDEIASLARRVSAEQVGFVQTGEDSAPEESGEPVPDEIKENKDEL
ncbi:hypothetical protein N7470_001953 [Penicillium chermesinum]|nr:hypothetical protein N7470_001953 [Penicillium chermesinum]